MADNVHDSQHVIPSAVSDVGHEGRGHDHDKHHGTTERAIYGSPRHRTPYASSDAGRIKMRVYTRYFLLQPSTPRHS